MKKIIYSMMLKIKSKFSDFTVNTVVYVVDYCDFEAEIEV